MGDGNLTGVAVTREAGDIVGIGLRGAPPELNSVSLDGTRTAGAIAGFTPNGDRAAPVADVVSVMPTAPVRFRRGSRLGTHKPEIPMVGIVRVDDDHGGAAGQGGSGAAKKGKATKGTKAVVEKTTLPAKKKSARKPRAKKAE